jgi:hypothetical protein
MPLARPPRRTRRDSEDGHGPYKYGNLTVQHRPHAAATDPRPARTTDIDLRATSSHRNGQPGRPVGDERQAVTGLG